MAKSKSSNEIATKIEKESFPTTSYLYTWGFNKYGQLGTSTQVEKTNQANLIKNFTEHPLMISGGENHTAIITQKMKLYMSGSNNFGQLGIEDFVKCTKPTLIPSLNTIDIVQVSCGADFTFALSSKSDVFSWGCNFKGQLGLGDYENRNLPSLVATLSPFGSNVSALLKNQLAHKRNKSSNAIALQNVKEFKEKSHSMDFSDPTNQFGKKIDENKLLLIENERIVEIACGALHTLAKTDANRLLSCGFGETYALGHGDAKNLCEFKPITFIKTATSRPSYQKNEEIEKISCGLTHSGCIRSGKIYLWGLFSNNESLALKIPTLIEISSNSKKKEELNFIDIKLGDTLSVFLSSKGEVFTMGENIEGQLGIPNVSSAEVPMRVNNLPIAANAIYCGRNHVFAVNSELKTVYGWGSNSFGQLGLKNRGQMVPTPRQISLFSDAEIMKLACGSFHTICLNLKSNLAEIEENDILSDDLISSINSSNEQHY